MNSLEVKMRGTLILLIGILILVIFGKSVYALGVTPGRTTVDFIPGLERDVQFSILNSENSDMDVVFFVQGELNSSIVLYDTKTQFTKGESSKGFRYKVKLPQNLGPGLHTADVVALEVPKLSGEGTFVGATVAVVTQLYVYVPYPGKYVDFDLNVLNSEQGDTATFIVPVVNRGKLGIGEVRAIIDVYTVLNEKVATLETDYTPLSSGSRTELSVQWLVNANPGRYLARITVFYDGESRSMEKEFAIGESVLNIESILVNDFTLGEIAKLQILVENKWNQELKGVFANLLVYNLQDEVMADIKSSSEDIPSLSRKELIAYWDTVGVEEGEYDGKLMVVYGEKSADKNLLLKISENSLDITGVGFAIRGNKARGGITLTTVLLVLVIILLIVNLAWFVFFRRFIGRREKLK